MDTEPPVRPGGPITNRHNTPTQQTRPSQTEIQIPKHHNQQTKGRPQGKPKGKQGSGQAPKQSVPNRHAYQRMNYLYQAAQVMITQKLRTQSSTYNHDNKPETMLAPDEGNKVTKDATLHALDNLSRRMNSTLRNVAQRMQIRLSTDIKRSLCRDCNASLQPATGNCISQVNRRESLLEISCMACKRIKRFPLHERRKRNDIEGDTITEAKSARAIKKRERLRKRKVRIREKAAVEKKSLQATVS